MSRDQLIELFRQIVGDSTDDGYFLPVEGINPIPNVLSGDGKLEYPRIVITPFISNVKTGEETVYCGEGDDKRRFDIKQYVTRFQLDIVGNTIPEINAIQEALDLRASLFIDPEMFTFSEDTGWVFGNNSYHNDDYNMTRNLAKLYNVNGVKMDRVDSILNVDVVNNSWYLDNTGLYVNPSVGEAEDIVIYEIINGLVFPDGESAYDKGIHNFWIVSDRMIPEKDLDVKRWSADFMIDYRTVRSMNIGSVLTEMKINVKEED